MPEEPKSIFTSQSDYTSLSERKASLSTVSAAQEPKSEASHLQQPKERSFSRRKPLFAPPEHPSNTRQHNASALAENLPISLQKADANTSIDLKHPRSDSIERSSKRTRPKHLNSARLSKPLSTIKPAPPSPLFFSHNGAYRPTISRWGSAEAAGEMVREEPQGSITTLKLARGSIGTVASPPRSTPTGSFASFDRISTPKSPDSRTRQSGLAMLGNIGIIELLEQDERLTFIIDVANTANFTPGPLQSVFVNSALRAYPVSFQHFVSRYCLIDEPATLAVRQLLRFPYGAKTYVRVPPPMHHTATRGGR